MDFRKISLWLFLIISSVFNSDCKLLNKYQISYNNGVDADDNCFCFKNSGNHKKVPEILSPNENNLERLMVYLYKDKLTDQVKLYIPNKEKQGHVPDLAFEVGDRLITVRDEKVKNIFDMNARNAYVDLDQDVLPINELSSDEQKPDDFDVENPVNDLPNAAPNRSGDDISVPDSAENNNNKIPEVDPPINLDFDKSSYHHEYDVPGSIPIYHQTYQGQHENPNKVFKIISQEVNIPHKIVYDGVYHEPKLDPQNHDFIYGSDHDVSDQTISHETTDPESSIYDPVSVHPNHDYIYDPMLDHDVSNQVISHEIKDPDSSIYGHFDPNLVDLPDPNKFIYNDPYTEPNNERPYYIDTDASFENPTPSKAIDDTFVIDKPGASDWDTYFDGDADKDTSKSQEQDIENSSSVLNQPPSEESSKKTFTEEVSTENSSSAPSQSIEETEKNESPENSNLDPNQSSNEENVKSESTEDTKSIEDPYSSAGQLNKDPSKEVSENKTKEESSSIEDDISGPKLNKSCISNECAIDKSSAAENISTESKSNEKVEESVENVSDGNNTVDKDIKYNSKESEHETKVNDNEYETFDRWFIQQMDRFRSYTEHDRAVNLLTIERYILKILHDNGMFVTSEGVLTDSFGTALDVNNLHLRPILIGNTMEFGKLLNAKVTDLVMPANMAYLQAILVTNANPSMILGIIPIGKTVIPPSAVNAFSTILTPHVHRNEPVTHHSLITKKYPKHLYETTKVNIKHVPGYVKRKPVVLHLTKHVPGTVRTLGKKKGKTVITVVKKRPIIVHSHHRLRQPPKVHVFGVGSGKSKFLTGDSADAVHKLLNALKEEHDPIKSEEATNKLLASLRKSTKSLDITPESSNESISEYSDEDVAGRIVGGSAATGSGAPLSAKGRIKNF